MVLTHLNTYGWFWTGYIIAGIISSLFWLVTSIISKEIKISDIFLIVISFLGGYTSLIVYACVVLVFVYVQFGDKTLYKRN